MIFRVTLNNAISGSQVISNPDGWKEIKVKLARDKKYHSLVEMIELPLIFCGDNGEYDGGYNYIRNVEDTQGVDAIIEILIECSDDEGDTYETFFDGLLELETIKEISDAEPYKLECNIVRNDFWSKFVNRESQQVNLDSTKSLDGDTLTKINNIELQLQSQVMNLEFNGYTDTINSSGLYNALSGEDYGVIDFADLLLSEIKTKFNYPLDVSLTRPFELFVVEYRGDYTFDIKVVSARNVVAGPYGDSTAATLNVLLQINDDAAITLTRTNVGVDGVDGRTEHTYSGTITLQKNDAIRLYFYDATGIVTFVIPGVSRESYLNIVGATIYTDTQTDAFLLRDAAESILSKIIGRNNVVYSEYLGDEAVDACASNFAIMKGLHVRGYSMNDKPMFMSFDDWWDGANGIFNLGLGYEEIAGTEYIRIEEKSHFYDDNYSITFSNVDKITRSYDKDKLFKSIEIGYEKWSAESASGVDDPQTKHTYNTRFKIIGKDEKILSKFIAASLAIEQTRRNRIEFGKDWRLDEDTIIIALSADSSPYRPETDEDFNTITNLLNGDTRYNIRLTPARNFERWKPYFNGCLQGYIPETFNFGSGEGNYDMSSNGTGSCDTGTLAENQDINVTTDFYHGAGLYEFEVDMSWEDYKTIRDNRNQAVRVSNTTSNYKLCKISEHEYDHYNATGTFSVWIKE